MSEHEIIELRVHGVSGTPPEELLDCPLVHQLAGDAKAGFYQPRLYEEERDPRRINGKPAERGPRLEGYAWGGLTSGAPTRALWLLLLPFTLTNVAPRLRPRGRPGGDGEKPGGLRLLWYISRLVALSMTVLIVTALSGVGVDLFAWQCRGGSGGADCSKASPGWIMRPLLGMNIEHRMAVGALLPLLAVVVLWQLSGRTINNYEGVSIASPDRMESIPGADEMEPDLTSPWMWSNEFMVRRLRHAHLQAAFATIAWIVMCPFVGPWRVVRIVLAVVAGGYLLVILWQPSYVGRRRSHRLFLTSWIGWGVLGACGVAIAVALLWFHPLGEARSDEGLPGFADTAEAIFITQVALFVVFSVLIWRMAITARPKSPDDAPSALGDTSAVVMSLLAVFFGAVFSSGIYVYATGWLTTGSIKPGFGQLSNAASLVFHVPTIVDDALRGYTVAVIVLAAMLVLAGLAFAVARVARMLGLIQWPRGFYADRMHEVYPDHYPTPDGLTPSQREENEDRARTIARIFWTGRQVDYAHRYLAVVVGVGFVITISFLGLLIGDSLVSHPETSNCLIKWHDYLGAQYSSAEPRRTNLVPASGSEHGFEHWLYEGFPSARSLQGTGAYLVVGTLILLVGLGAAAFRSTSKRRSVGILWDLASFWPRAAHPFAAPCYAERAVPDLVTRLNWHIRERGARVVLAAHSQGTVIGAATLCQLEAIERCEAAMPKPAGAVPKPLLRAIAYLSFGCVLRRLYSRYFPAYFCAAALDELREEMLTSGDGPARWRNLWRYSDYLGGQVMSGPPPREPAPSVIDIRSTDPQWERHDGDTIWPKANRHSYYWADELFAPTVAELARML